MLLLDTHAWIWLITGDAEFGKSKALQRVLNSARKGKLRVSAISLWEVSMLAAKGRVQFNIPVLNWLKDALNAPGISLEPLSPEIAVESTTLPQHFHGDPADRILVATARCHNYELVTRDRKIIEYGDAGFCKVVTI